MYAINLADYLKHRRDAGLAVQLSPLVDPAPDVITCEPGGVAIPLQCDDDRGAAITRNVRRVYKPNQIRIYHSTDRVHWTRV